MVIQKWYWVSTGIRARCATMAMSATTSEMMTMRVLGRTVSTWNSHGVLRNTGL